MTDLRKKLLKNKINPMSTVGLGTLDPANFKKSNWDEYFDSKETNDDGFCIYRSGKSGPYIFFLHGAGLSGLSFAPVVKRLKDKGYQMIAFDSRNHGESQLGTDNGITFKKPNFIEETWNITNLVADSANIIKSIIEKESNESEDVQVFIVGHSMGGAVAARTAQELPEKWIKGVVLIDIVEGSALEALPYMKNILSRRPDSFKTIEDAVKWAVSSNTVRNLESSKISIPSQLIEVQGRFKWRVNLVEGEKYWPGWYSGLSSTFLSLRCPKLLMLAGTDRLDKDLTVGQMQGKFQLVVLGNVGHCLHEDSPKEAADNIKTFIEHQKEGLAFISKISHPM